MRINNLRNYLNEVLSTFCPIVDKMLISNDNVLLSKAFRYSKIYLIEYLTRQSSNLNALRIILKENTKIRREHSIGLLLRNSLSDLLYLYHLNFPEIVNPNVNKDFFENEVLKLFSDQLVKSLRYKENRVHNIDKFSKYIKLKEGKVTSNFDKPILNRQIFEELKTRKGTIQFSNIYNLWEIYSKYEHFGLLTNMLQTRSNYDLLVSNFKSITMIIHGINLALDNISVFSDEVKIEKSDSHKIFSILVGLTEKAKLL